MPYRIGLMFWSPPEDLPDAGAIASLMESVEKRSEPVRGPDPVCLCAFVCSDGMPAFVSKLAGTDRRIEALAMTEAGVAAYVAPAPPAGFPCRPDVKLNALLAQCHVVVIMCATKAEAAEAQLLLEMKRNTACLVAIVTTAERQHSLWEIDPAPRALDSTDWQIRVAELWRRARDNKIEHGKRKHTMLGLAFPLFASFLLRRPFQTLREKAVPETPVFALGVSRPSLGKLSTADQKAVDQQARALWPAFQTSNSLGKHYSNVFRTACLLVPLTIGISTVLAVAAVLNHHHAELWHVTEGVLLVAAAVLFTRAVFGHFHEHWVNHRLLAELLRPAMLFQLLRTIPDTVQPSGDADTWVRQTRAFWLHFRGLGPLDLTTTPPPDLRSCRRSALEDYARSQAAFHSDFAHQHFRTHRSLTRLSAWAFLITLLICFAQLLASAWMTSEISKGLLLLTLVSACAAFAISVVAHQLGFEAIAERSEAAALAMSRLAATIEHGAATASGEQLYLWSRELSALIVDEQHGWYRQIGSIRLHL
ncbi:MAG: hypothetical protein IT168_25875 [Bryobacterales bacterium]|nr:hypothetical protein [Bryobacterales bacterium]